MIDGLCPKSLTRQNYGEALKEVASLETKDPKELVAKKSEFSDQISAKETELNAKISVRIFLQDESMVIRRLYSDFDDAQSELDSMRARKLDRMLKTFLILALR